MLMRITSQLLHDMPNNELRVYLALVLMIPGKGGMEISYDELSDFSGVNKRTIQKIIPMLEKKGYVRREWDGGPFPPTYYISEK